MMNFCRRFIPNAASIQAPLNSLLAGPKVKNSHLTHWTPELQRAFTDCKTSIAQATLLAHPDSTAELAIQTDASDVAIGAVLQQRKGDNWQPLSFFSRKLKNAQRKYSPYDRELLSIYEAIRHFRYMVEARIFSVYTDHKPITFAFSTRRDKCSPRQFRYLDYIGQFTTDIRYIPRVTKRLIPYCKTYYRIALACNFDGYRWAAPMSTATHQRATTGRISHQHTDDKFFI